MGTHLAEQVLLRHVQHELCPEERAGVEAHLAQCARCTARARKLERLDRLLVVAAAEHLDASLVARYGSDPTLSAAERCEVEEHAALCPTCREELALLARLDAALPAQWREQAVRELPETSAPEGSLSAQLAALQRALRAVLRSVTAGPAGLDPLETRVMEALWDAGTAQSTADIHEALRTRGAPVAYSSVVATLGRLRHQGLVGDEDRGGQCHHRARLSRRDLLGQTPGQRLHALLNALGQPAMAYFVEALNEVDPDKLEQLRALVEEKRKHQDEE